MRSLSVRSITEPVFHPQSRAAVCRKTYSTSTLKGEAWPREGRPLGHPDGSQGVPSAVDSAWSRIQPAVLCALKLLTLSLPEPVVPGDIEL